MFTGIIQSVGRVGGGTDRGGDLRLDIETAKLDLSDVTRGDSIAVNGVCLTVVVLGSDGFSADVSRETLAQSTLGTLRTGRSVNLEKALTLSTPLGGHLVSGHVDGIGRVLDRRDDARSVRFRVEAPPGLARYIAAKGSISIDGVSLTVTSVDGAVFDLNVVPHTLQETIIQDYRAGTDVNIEVDLIARYLERLMLRDREDAGVTRELLARKGFV